MSAAAAGGRGGEDSTAPQRARLLPQHSDSCADPRRAGQAARDGCEGVQASGGAAVRADGGTGGSRLNAAPRAMAGWAARRQPLRRRTASRALAGAAGPDVRPERNAQTAEETAGEGHRPAAGGRDCHAGEGPGGPDSGFWAEEAAGIYGCYARCAAMCWGKCCGKCCDTCRTQHRGNPFSRHR